MPRPKAVDWPTPHAYRIALDNYIDELEKPENIQALLSTLITDPVIVRVCMFHISRSELGVKKYGTTLHDNRASLVEWAQHAKEELGDALNYLERFQGELLGFDPYDIDIAKQR